MDVLHSAWLILTSGCCAYPAETSMCVWHALKAHIISEFKGCIWLSCFRSSTVISFKCAVSQTSEAHIYMIKLSYNI